MNSKAVLLCFLLIHLKSCWTSKGVACGWRYCNHCNEFNASNESGGGRTWLAYFKLINIHWRAEFPRTFCQILIAPSQLTAWRCRSWISLWIVNPMKPGTHASASQLNYHGFRQQQINIDSKMTCENVIYKMMAIDPGLHDDVIKWKHFPRYWSFVRKIHRFSVNSPHKAQWRGALMFSLICVWINGGVNNREAGDLRRYRAQCQSVWTVIDITLDRRSWLDSSIHIWMQS